MKTVYINVMEEAMSGPAAPALAEAPVSVAEEFARSVGARRRQAGAPVRLRFTTGTESDRPPATLLLSNSSTGGGGRGGQVRLKLYVSLLWVCSAAPFDVARPNRAWAALLGLDDPDGKGVRRIRGAVQELEERHLITVEDRGGRPSRLHLLSDTGDGTPYESPTEAYNALRHSGTDTRLLARHQYFRVPSTIWTDGYISRLSGPGFIMLLILLSEQRGQARPVWLSKSRSADRFGLADSTINAGLRELRTLGLTTVTRRSISDDGRLISQRRYRNVHELLISSSAAPVS